MKTWTRIPRDQDARRLTLVVIVVVALLGLQLWLWGRVFDAASQFRNRQTQQQQLSNVQQLTEDIRRVDSGQQALIEQAAVAYPLPETVPHVVERVEALAETHGLTLSLESIAEQRVARPQPRLIPFDLNLALSGPPRSLLAFLDAVEHMQEFTRVESWSMEPLPQGTAAEKAYGMTMKLRFFLQSNLSHGQAT